MAQKAVVNRPGKRKVLGVYVRNNWQLYLLLLIPVVFVIVFKYAAYPGLRMAFMNYKPAKGYAGSKWVGWETFEKIFRDKDFHRALKNSLAFNFLDLAIGFPVPIILALLLNELRFPRYIIEDELDSRGIPYEEVTTMEEAMPHLDILYMTRVQKERFFNEADYIRLKDTYILTPDKLEPAKEDLVIMHPLPRVNEISVAVDDDPRAHYFDQARCGMFIRMALILKMLEVTV